MEKFRFILNFVLSILPSTRFFWVKQKLCALFGVKVGKGASITGDIKVYGRGKVVIGVNTWIGIGCRFYTNSENGHIYIGNNCDIAPNVIFHTGSHQIGPTERRAGFGYSESINVGDGSWIGVASTVLAGATIGGGVVIAAGAVVRAGNFAGNSIYAGCPAKLVRTLK